MRASRPPGPLVLFAAAAAAHALAPRPAAAHAFLSLPESRNYDINWRYCPHCLNNGGAGPSSDFGQLVWPATTHPACGTAELADARRVVQDHAPGQVIDVKVFFSTQHGGRHWLKLCPRAAVDLACFDQTAAL
ncbi:chitin binding domain-containing [Micractinium conductrix]|uniref:Chitin binding domain-containing n=1 Tax=Micractinium conductrix TaxID=554055 RepID=A0A2P6V3V6_9CHLO|nr:chitin binding domain-containing [Micractinium conductrix]|eukprot:PSC68770.1 chitin binding domain-containing [Micractinium conductrix]